MRCCNKSSSVTAVRTSYHLLKHVFISLLYENHFKFHFKGDDTTHSIPLVTIHGIKGCQLVDKTDGSVGWITPGAATGIKNPDLRLPLDWENGKQKSDNYVAGVCVSTVSLTLSRKFYEKSQLLVLEKIFTNPG